MATGPARYKHCGEWQRAKDCGLDERGLHFALAVLWALTALALLVRVCPVFRKAPAGYARWCLALAAVSAAFNVLDSALYIVYGKPRERHGGYRQNTFTFAGSVFMVFALTLAARAWCDVAGALQRFSPRYKCGGPGHNSMQRALAGVRGGYTIISILHVPVAVFRAMADQPLGPEIDMAILVWSAWAFLSAACGLTFLAMLMWYIATRCLQHTPDSGGLKMMTWVNLSEQVVYDVCLGIVALLFYSDGYSLYGGHQAAYFALYTALYWVMHAQVLIFFVVVDPNDPLYSEVEFSNLMALAGPATAEAVRAPGAPSRVGVAWEDNACPVIVRAPASVTTKVVPGRSAGPDLPTVQPPPQPAACRTVPSAQLMLRSLS